MTIRIKRMERPEGNFHYVCLIGIKGLQNQAINCCLQTTIDGHGLSYAKSEFDSRTELFTADRFHAQERLNGEQVTYRVAAHLVCLECGPEFYNDRDSSTDGGPGATFSRASGEPSS